MTVSPRAAQLGGNPLPATADEAIVSIPYLVARTLADPSSVGRPIPAQFVISSREREILGTIHLVADSALDDSAASISLNDGELESACPIARGSANKPMTIAEIKSKFCSICGLDEPHLFMRAIERGDDDLAALVGVR